MAIPHNHKCYECGKKEVCDYACRQGNDGYEEELCWDCDAKFEAQERASRWFDYDE